MPSKPFAPQVSPPDLVGNDDVMRIAHERVMLDEGIADIKAGRVVPDHEVDGMLDRLIGGQPLNKTPTKTK